MARADAPSADISTVESFKDTILNAKSLIFNNVASGNYFAELLDRLGIGEAVKKKVVRADSSIVFQRILQGDRNDIGVATIPLIKATKGLRLIGPLPAELQNYLIYLAALMTSATRPRAAAAFIDFLCGNAAKVAFSDHSVE
jgi:molybdate transport system substrate-binding protein